MKTPRDFVEMYYPNYYNSDKIMLLNDLATILDGDHVDKSSAFNLYKSKYKHNQESLVKDYQDLLLEVYEEAIRFFLSCQVSAKTIPQNTKPLITSGDIKNAGKEYGLELTDEQVEEVLKLYPTEQENDLGATWILVVEHIFYQLEYLK